MALDNNFEVEIIDHELVTIELYVIDRIGGVGSLSQLLDTQIVNPLNGQGLLLEGGYWKNQTIVATADPSKFVQGETPTPAPPVLKTEKYTTANNFVTGTLEVFLNGMKLLPSDLTIYGNTQFSISTLDTIVSDVVTVNYIKP